MNKQSNIKVRSKSEPQGWAAALADAEAHLADARKNLHEWQAVVRACKKKIAAGEPFPGEEREAS